VIQLNDTIFALSTARGRAGLAVVRVSGPAAGDILCALSGKTPLARQATLAALRDPATGDIIDRGLVLWFPTPASVTGEDVAEFHIHGGPAILNGLIAALKQAGPCRLAEPGEFTRRAFENGKLDLSAAEGIADLIDAETAAQRRQALHQADGTFARIADGWAARLLTLLAQCEATIDFADEDIPGDLADTVRRDIAALGVEIAAHLADGRRGERVRDGISVALIGPPNSGKSSLLNLLAGRSVAIVSATAGTTRDIIEAHLDLAGYPVSIADTAGLRPTTDEIEAEGIRRARARAGVADIVVLVLDASDPVSRETDFTDPKPDIVLWNKIDQATAPKDALGISAASGEGIPHFIARLTAQVETLLAGPPALVTRQRHRDALDAVVAALIQGETAPEPGLMAEDLRAAVSTLGRITGKVDVEAVLDVIFRSFCIGK
jgi:tRNA modification GTPase